MPSYDLTKKYFKIKEAAEIRGVNQSTLRFWESEFPQIKPWRSPSNNRFYTPQDIETLKMVYYLVKIKGLKIDSAREQMRLNSKNISKRMTIIEKLSDARDELQMMLDALGKRKQED